MFNKVHPVENTEKKWISRDTALSEFRQFQSGNQSAGVMNFNPIVKKMKIWIFAGFL